MRQETGRKAFRGPLNLSDESTFVPECVRASRKHQGQRWVLSDGFTGWFWLPLAVLKQGHSSIKVLSQVRSDLQEKGEGEVMAPKHRAMMGQSNQVSILSLTLQ